MTTDKPIELAQCSQCSGYLYKCQVSGIRALVDPTPLGTMENARAALLAGKQIYRVIRHGKRPHKLQNVMPRYLGAYVAEAVADHDCGALHRHGGRVETTPVDPPRAPVTHLQPLGGNFPQGVRESGSQGHTELWIKKASLSAHQSRAENVTPRRIKGTRCDTCREIITVDTKDVVSIEHDGRLVYAQHISC